MQLYVPLSRSSMYVCMYIYVWMYVKPWLLISKDEERNFHLKEMTPFKLHWKGVIDNSALENIRNVTSPASPW